MVKPLLDPVAVVQNPALCAALLWRFGLGYQEEKFDDTPSMLLFFAVLPLVLHRPTVDIVTQTRIASGLPMVAAKIGNRREDLIAVHERAMKLRTLTLESLALGVATRLFTVDYERAHARANEATSPRPPERLKNHFSAADKVGRWFAKVSPAQVFRLLQVEI